MNATGNMKEPVKVEDLVDKPIGAKEAADEALRKRALERRNQRLKERKKKETRGSHSG